MSLETKKLNHLELVEQDMNQLIEKLNSLPDEFNTKFTELSPFPKSLVVSCNTRLLIITWVGYDDLDENFYCIMSYGKGFETGQEVRTRATIKGVLRLFDFAEYWDKEVKLIS